MKTPQEEAEEMAAKCAASIWEVGEGHKEDYLKQAPEVICVALALPELIAVARAAIKSQKTAAIFNDEDVELCDVLQALRATGKMEL